MKASWTSGRVDVSTAKNEGEVPVQHEPPKHVVGFDDRDADERALIGETERVDTEEVPAIGRPKRTKVAPQLEAVPWGEWPKPSEVFELDWHAIPEQYRAGSHPDDTIVLYRGATAEQEERGFVSNAFRIEGFGALKAVAELVAGPISKLARAIDRHTSSSELSPFVSAAWSEASTALFAKRDRQVYRLEVPAKRLLVDGDNTGNVQEALIVGAVFPHEISRGTSSGAYPERWKDLAAAWKIRAQLRSLPHPAVRLCVTTYGPNRGVQLFVPKALEGTAEAEALRRRVEQIGTDAFVEMARAQKRSQEQILAIGTDGGPLLLLFERSQRGVFARSDRDATLEFSIIPDQPA